MFFRGPQMGAWIRGWVWRFWGARFSVQRSPNTYFSRVLGPLDGKLGRPKNAKSNHDGSNPPFVALWVFCAWVRREQRAPKNATHPRTQILGLRFRVCCVFGCSAFPSERAPKHTWECNTPELKSQILGTLDDFRVIAFQVCFWRLLSIEVSLVLGFNLSGIQSMLLGVSWTAVIDHWEGRFWKTLGPSHTGGGTMLEMKGHKLPWKIGMLLSSAASRPRILLQKEANQFREKQRGGTQGRGKHTIKPLPQNCFGPPPLMIRFPPPLAHAMSFSLEPNGHRPVWRGHFVVRFPPPPPKIAWYGLPPPPPCEFPSISAL